jgi:hypothetical protein
VREIARSYKCQTGDDFEAPAMIVFREICRRLHPQLYIRMEIARLERQEKALRHPAMSGDKRIEQEARLSADLSELHDWQLTFEDKALIRRAARIGVYLDEIVFVNVPDRENVGRYYRIGTFGDELLRDEFRASLLKAVRQREPVYRKERQEQIELIVKIISALTAAATRPATRSALML